MPGGVLWQQHKRGHWGHLGLSASAHQGRVTMSDEAFQNSTASVLALGQGTSASIYVPRLNKALLSSCEVIRFLSVPNICQICS